jgi:hypothetical protein
MDNFLRGSLTKFYTKFFPFSFTFPSCQILFDIFLLCWYNFLTREKIMFIVCDYICHFQRQMNNHLVVHCHSYPNWPALSFLLLVPLRRIKPSGLFPFTISLKVLILQTVCMTPWTYDQPIASLLPIQDHKTQNNTQANFHISNGTRGHYPSVWGVTLHFDNLFLSTFNVPAV